MLIVYGVCPSVACLNEIDKIQMRPTTAVVKMFLSSINVIALSTSNFFKVSQLNEIFNDAQDTRK